MVVKLGIGFRPVLNHIRIKEVDNTIMDVSTQTADDSVQILQTVEELQYDITEMTQKEVEVKYKTFKENYKKIYEAILNPQFTFNLSEFKKMLEFRDTSRKNNVPDFYRDVTIGEHYAKKYIYPKVGEPTTEQKKNAGKIISEKICEKK